MGGLPLVTLEKMKHNPNKNGRRSTIKAMKPIRRPFIVVLMVLVLVNLKAW